MCIRDSDHLVHAFICSGVDDGGLADAEVALLGRGLDLGFIADQDDIHQVFLEKAVCRLAVSYTHLDVYKRQ